MVRLVQTYVLNSLPSSLETLPHMTFCPVWDMTGARLTAEADRMRVKDPSGFLHVQSGGANGKREGTLVGVYDHAASAASAFAPEGWAARGCRGGWTAAGASGRGGWATTKIGGIIRKILRFFGRS